MTVDASESPRWVSYYLPTSSSWRKPGPRGDNRGLGRDRTDLTSSARIEALPFARATVKVDASENPRWVSFYLPGPSSWRKPGPRGDNRGLGRDRTDLTSSARIEALPFARATMTMDASESPRWVSFYLPAPSSRPKARPRAIDLNHHAGFIPARHWRRGPGRRTLGDRPRTVFSPRHGFRPGSGCRNRGGTGCGPARRRTPIPGRD